MSCNIKFLKIIRIAPLLIFLFLQVKCDGQVNNEVKSFQVSINNNITNIEVKKLVLKELIKESGDNLTLTDIDSVKFIGNFRLKDFSNDSRIYKIKLSYNLPTVYHYNLVLIVNDNQGYLIPLDTVELVRIQKSSNEYYFAGRYINRNGYGYFKIFKFNNNHMFKIFESHIAISNFSYDCTSFKNGNLQLQNIDVNKDGYLDLKFSGIKYFYCKGLENYGRGDKKPIKQEKITIIFYYNPQDSTWVHTN